VKALYQACRWSAVAAPASFLEEQRAYMRRGGNEEALQGKRRTA